MASTENGPGVNALHAIIRVERDGITQVQTLPCVAVVRTPYENVSVPAVIHARRIALLLRRGRGECQKSTARDDWFSTQFYVTNCRSLQRL